MEIQLKGGAGGWWDKEEGDGKQGLASYQSPPFPSHGSAVSERALGLSNKLSPGAVPAAAMTLGAQLPNLQVEKERSLLLSSTPPSPRKRR